MMRVEALERLVVVDVETTGVNPFNHRILSLALVPVAAERPSLELYIKDVGTSWQDVASGYFARSKAAWLKGAVPATEACARMRSYLESTFGGSVTLVGHNVGFDIAFLRQLAFRAGLDELPLISHRAVDTHTILYLLHVAGQVPDTALSSEGAFEYFDVRISPTERHTALGDARATRSLFLRALEMWSRVSAGV